ncbi:hypothetical protein ACTWJ8_27910 [Streptomyces sp. SDT5-1]|uniref:hypothetical protein n=1 Tax=Streptomyces sp. SDT5-1 TaxID=3406418 RepID=UPI003FD3699D
MRLGRWVAVSGAVALVALTGGWLLLPAGTVRTVLTWAALGVLVVCVGAVAGQVRSGRRISRAEAYGLAVAEVREPGRQASTVPATVHGTWWVWVRVTSVAVAVVTTAVLAASLGFAQPERSSTAAAISEADYVIEELSVVSVARVDAAGSSPRSSTMADYTVELPTADGGKEAAATFRAYNGKGVREVGDTYEVAHVPSRPDLGAVGDISVAAVEARLAGHTLPYRNILLIAVVWAVVAAAAVGMGTGVASRPRGGRRVGDDWVALRVVVSGQTEHVEGTDKQGKNSGRYACLTLRTDAGEDVPLAIAAKLSAAVPVLTGSTGWLLWDPRGGGKAKVAADFVADEGWQLPGRVPGSVATRVAASPRGPVPTDPGRRVRLLEPGAFWVRTVPVGLLVGLLVSAAAAAALLLPVNGGWRIWTSLAVVLAPIAGWVLAKEPNGTVGARETTV